MDQIISNISNGERLVEQLIEAVRSFVGGVAASNLHIAFLAIHRTGDFLAHVSTQELPRRGFRVLGMNSRFKNNEADVEAQLTLH